MSQKSWCKWDCLTFSVWIKWRRPLLTMLQTIDVVSVMLWNYLHVLRLNFEPLRFFVCLLYYIYFMNFSSELWSLCNCSIFSDISYDICCIFFNGNLLFYIRIVYHCAKKWKFGNFISLMLEKFPKAMFDDAGFSLSCYLLATVFFIDRILYLQIVSWNSI